MEKDSRGSKENQAGLFYAVFDSDSNKIGSFIGKKIRLT